MKSGESLMSDKMTPIPFERLLPSLLKEYREKQSLMGVPVTRNTSEAYANAIGPASGPHTQLAGNIIAAYAAGATYFELKTVQIMTGDALGIAKPCIYAATEVFNTEWSTELSVEEAESEYIKAYLLLKILIAELKLGNPDHFQFIMSVGYDLKGIQSPEIDAFINHMMDASDAAEWQRAHVFLSENQSLLQHVTPAYIAALSPVVSDTIALSTMHGCHKDEIEQIAQYLLTEKRHHVYVKMNPTLLGRDAIRSSLDALGYTHLAFDETIFEKDISFESACAMCGRLMAMSREANRMFGVKLTNTFPVSVLRDELAGETMYLSGPALYPIAVQLARMLSERFQGKLPISFSGGAEPENIKLLLETGMTPVTVSSYLLKPSGYKNLAKLAREADKAVIPKHIDNDKLAALAAAAQGDAHYRYRQRPEIPRSEVYSPLCAACNNCVDICPNRANRAVQMEGKKVVVHLDHLCNDCGACAYYCIKGHLPYLEKVTLFTSEWEFECSVRPSIYWHGTCHARNVEAEVERQLQNFDWEAFLT
jgi:putative selenate reductase